MTHTLCSAWSCVAAAGGWRRRWRAWMRRRVIQDGLVSMLMNHSRLCEDSSPHDTETSILKEDECIEEIIPWLIADKLSLKLTSSDTRWGRKTDCLPGKKTWVFIFTFIISLVSTEKMDGKETAEGEGQCLLMNTGRGNSPQFSLTPRGKHGTKISRLRRLQIQKHTLNGANQKEEAPSKLTINPALKKRGNIVSVSSLGKKGSQTALSLSRLLLSDALSFCCRVVWHRCSREE